MTTEVHRHFAAAIDDGMFDGLGLNTIAKAVTEINEFLYEKGAMQQPFVVTRSLLEKELRGHRKRKLEDQMSRARGASKSLKF